jgi:DNA-binding NarL/FixJ family response regulator
LPFRILVADDHEIVRRGVCALLASQNGWHVCGEATDGREAVKEVDALSPDVVILDIGMPNLNGIEATRQILKKHPGTKILILTLHESREVVRSVMSSGARGLLLKTDAARELVTAVSALQEGNNYFATKITEIAETTPDDATPSSDGTLLTAREREIVQLLAEGNTCRQVADALGLSIKTADTHRSKIMRKLGIHSIRELVLFAVRNNIIQVADSSLSTPGIRPPDHAFDLAKK